MSTKIEWTEETWNPITGCTKVSQGCKHCYAERWAPKVFAGQTIKQPDGTVRPRAFTDLLLHLDRLDAPLHWIRPRRIFVNSMSDLFHEEVPADFITAVWQTMADSPQHTYQILTKRPQRMLDYLLDALTLSSGYVAPPLPNVWLGVSVEDQATADERIPLLLQTPAAVRFLSCEPLLGPIDLYRYYEDETDNNGPIYHGVDWVIAGGESGPKARPSHPDWFRALRDQCAAAGVPYFFKQWGEWGPCETEVNADEFGRVVWPLEESVLEAVYDLGTARRFTTIKEHGIEFGRFGKKLNGRTLDGREHMEYPA